MLKKLIVCNKSLPTHREGDAVYIELNTGTPDMAVKREGGSIRVHWGVTIGFTNVLWHKILRIFKKDSQKYVVHTST